MPLPSARIALPQEIREFLREADQRIEAFAQDRLVPGFVPSDFPTVYQALRNLTGSGLATGPRFCEWGSGFGVVTCLAAWLGLEAYGIEIDGDLVRAARQLAADFGVRAEFLQDSFIPPGSERSLDAGEVAAWLTVQPSTVHEEWGLDPEDFDLIFAYPWPDEEQVIDDLFQRHAAPGALLLTYHGREEVRLRRKIRRKRR